MINVNVLFLSNQVNEDTPESDEETTECDSFEMEICNRMADIIRLEQRHAKFHKHLSRPSKIGAAAICSGITGLVNEQLFRDIQLHIISPNNLRGIFFRENRDIFTIKAGMFGIKPIIVKGISDSSIIEQKNHSIVLAHEFRILQFLGPHRHLIDYYGLVELNGIPQIVLDDDFKFAGFERFYQENRRFDIYTIQALFRDITSVVEFLHVKGVIHMNITEDSFVFSLDVSGPEWRYFPILCDFSCCCLVSDVKVLTPQLQSRFRSTKHLPVEVMRGEKLPSFNCDIYAVAVLMSHFSNRLNTPQEQHIFDEVTIKLLRNTTDIFIDSLYDFIKN